MNDEAKRKRQWHVRVHVRKVRKVRIHVEMHMHNTTHLHNEDRALKYQQSTTGHWITVLQ